MYYFVLLGSPFPSVFNISGKLNENTAYIKWDAEKNAKKNWQYVVYYGTNMQELFNGIVNTFIFLLFNQCCTIISPFKLLIHKIPLCKKY